MSSTPFCAGSACWSLGLGPGTFERPSRSVCESFRIQECLGGDDPLLILDVNRGQPIGAGASAYSYFGPFLAFIGGLYWGVFPPSPPWLLSCPAACCLPVSFPRWVRLLLGSWWVALSPVVMGSLLLPPLLWGFHVCLVVIAFSNPGFHLAQTNGLSQAVYQAYACGDQSFLWDWLLDRLRSFILGALLTMPSSSPA